MTVKTLKERQSVPFKLSPHDGVLREAEMYWITDPWTEFVRPAMQEFSKKIVLEVHRQN
jgi:hypothetical protein